MHRFAQRKQSTIYNQQSTSSGFTLIELLVAFSLITIISGIGFASFVSYSREQTVIQAAANLKQTIELARANANSFVKPSLCSENDELLSYKVNFCRTALCQTSSDYEMIVSCGAIEEAVGSYSFAQNTSSSDVPGSPICTTILFNTVSKTAEGVPCEMNIDGYGNQRTLSIDSQGYVSY